MNTFPLSLSKASVIAVLNTCSGSYTSTAEQELRDILLEHGISDPRVMVAAPAEVTQTFDDAIALQPDILIVLGGDGTIRCGAEVCNLKSTYLIPLPGGTMNMLPKALYGTRSWKEALSETLQNPRLQTVSGGRVCDRTFYIAAIAGAPTLWTHVREAAREVDIPKVIEKGMHAFQNMLSSKVTYSFSKNSSGEAGAIAVLCPLISEVLPNEARTLEAAVIEVEDAGGVLELASAAAFSTWRESQNVSVIPTTSITITSDGDIPLILDGETMELGNSLTIEFVPKAFTAIVPA